MYPPRGPNIIQIILTLGPIACKKYYLHWAIWILYIAVNSEFHFCCFFAFPFDSPLLGDYIGLFGCIGYGLRLRPSNWNAVKFGGQSEIQEGGKHSCPAVALVLSTLFSTTAVAH